MVIALVVVGGWVVDRSRQARPAELAVRPAAVATRPAEGATRPAEGATRPAAVAARPAGVTRPAVEVLRGWDEARAAAYASGSVRALRELYVGAAGAGDVRLLRSYLRRGYRVEGMRMQLLAVEVLGHGPGTWRLRVTDRLAGGVAVGNGERLTLPRDRASTRTVRLVRDGSGRWQVASVSA
jgi:hypothetical protein